MRSKTKRRIAALAASTVLCVAGLGATAGTASAGGGPELTTPGGHVVTGPVEARDGAMNAFNRVGARTNAPAGAGLSLSFPIC